MTTRRRAPRGSYVRLARCGELDGRARALDALLSDCVVCPLECRIDRRSELGTCATGADAVIASWCPHHNHRLLYP